MTQTEQLIKVGNAYIDAINKLKEDRPDEVAHILDILDCIHPEPGYHFGIYIEEPSPDEAVTHACDQSWFHCYQGDEEPIMRRPFCAEKYSNIDHHQNMTYLRFTFNLFNHLIVEPTAMGAWQAYLLSISKTLLPFSGHLYYTKRELIMTSDQLQQRRLWAGLKKISDIVTTAKDVSPFVQMDESQAWVSSCYWSDWGGLIREYAKFSFINGRTFVPGDFYHETLYKYDCGIMY